MKHISTISDRYVAPNVGVGAANTATRSTSLYPRFLEFPALVVLLTLWLMGVVLVGLCTLTLYSLFWVLLEALTGS